ncbi:MAG TPA: HD domain-containing protein [Bacteroidia bacterium]|nr:HD domain-containing protein [Bacteroidia bacterium]HRS59869.1 HD domain-containing protein [Bacteroidia bacterium]HRU68345.1 HD domain-containing protein [Bacteroidia bacterium]
MWMSGDKADISPETEKIAEKLILKYFPEGTIANEMYFKHVRAVCRKAFKIAEKLNLSGIDTEKLYLSCMFHDIGIVHTFAPDIGCFGKHPYLSHAYLGREILEKEGFTDIAPICENHVGVGITATEIAEKKLPLPLKDIGPQTLVEKIVCIADKFFSKSRDNLEKELPLEVVRKKMAKLGEDKLIIFNELLKELKID